MTVIGERRLTGLLIGRLLGIELVIDPSMLAMRTRDAVSRRIRIRTQGSGLIADMFPLETAKRILIDKWLMRMRCNGMMVELRKQRLMTIAIS